MDQGWAQDAIDQRNTDYDSWKNRNIANIKEIEKALEHKLISDVFVSPAFHDDGRNAVFNLELLLKNIKHMKPQLIKISKTILDLTKGANVKISYKGSNVTLEKYESNSMMHVEYSGESIGLVSFYVKSDSKLL